MITQQEAAQPGVIIFGPIGGIVPGVFPVGAGQLLLADRKARLTWRRWRKFRHVLVVTQAYGAGLEYASGPSRPLAVQAMPRGAEEIELAAKHWTAEYVYVRPPYPVTWLEERDGRAMGEAVAAAARLYIGTPYNFLTYGALAARKLRLVLSDRLLRRWISTRKDMMCSQLADQALADAGFHVFDDGRLPQDVVPAELFRALIDMPGTKYTFAGKAEWTDGARFWELQGEPS
jgi:hypothetical protein